MTLTQEEKDIIKATVPILESGGPQLTRHFYARMMEHNPEVRKFFNQTHQKDGSQANALARAVLLYAKNIDHLENLGSVAPIIIEKHVALDIHAEHYPIVGTNLIAAMQEVLGPDVATPAVTDAWTKAYFQLADILIGAENDVYSKLASAEGGWSGFRQFVISKREQVAKSTVSFWIEPSDGKEVLRTVPGQYITLRVVIDGQEMRRNYSVSSAPSNKGYEISVKNIGLVSSHLHSLPVNAQIELRPPIGGFLIDAETSKQPIVFVAGGIGITPLLAMMRSGQQGKLLFYARNNEERAFLNEIRQLANVEYIDTLSSRPSAGELSQHVTPESHVFMCGPQGFMKSVRDSLLANKISDAQIHYELFGSGQVLQ